VSEFFVNWWWAMLFAVLAGGSFFGQSWRRSEKVQAFVDRLLLRVPVFGGLVEKSVVARWTRTMSTLFAAGVPLVEALDSVGGASGNSLYAAATEQIQRDVSAGGSLTNAMQSSGVFPVMVLQMAAIGEESGSLDHMLGKAAEFYEEEVDEMVKGLSSLMEPFIIVFLGGLIAAIVVSMYLPLFKMGAVV
jgi:type IV pilus assembly protein PilC